MLITDLMFSLQTKDEIPTMATVRHETPERRSSDEHR